MAKVTVERKATGMASVDRRSVKPGTVFQVAGKNGQPLKNLYGALGNNGRLYSINLKNGQLASTAKGDKKVIPVGTFTVKSDFDRKHRRYTLRSQVVSGEIFQVKGGEKSYVHLGTLKDGRLCSLNMADPLNDDYAVTGKGNSHVNVIGVAVFDAKVAG